MKQKLLWITISGLLLTGCATTHPAKVTNMPDNTINPPPHFEPVASTVAPQSMPQTAPNLTGLAPVTPSASAPGTVTSSPEIASASVGADTAPIASLATANSVNAATVTTASPQAAPQAVTTPIATSAASDSGLANTTGASQMATNAPATTTPALDSTAAAATAAQTTPGATANQAQAAASTATAMPAAASTSTSAPVAVAPAAAVTPDILANTRAFCHQLKQQLLTQLPYKTLQRMGFRIVTGVYPLTQTGSAAVCNITLRTNGDNILRDGLTPDFMVSALERLDWQNTPDLQAYNADSPTAHRIVMTNGQYLAVVNYSFAPPPGVCSQNQPIAACKYSQKKWQYRLLTQVFSKS